MNKVVELLETIFQVKWLWNKLCSYINSKWEALDRALEIADYERTVLKDERWAYESFVGLSGFPSPAYTLNYRESFSALCTTVAIQEPKRPKRPLSITESSAKMKRFKEVIALDDLAVLKVKEPSQHLMNRVEQFYRSYGSVDVSSKFQEVLDEAQKLKSLWVDSIGLRDLINSPIEIEVEDEIEVPYDLNFFIKRVIQTSRTLKERSSDNADKEKVYDLFRNITDFNSTLEPLNANSFGKGRPKLAKDIKKIFRDIEKLESYAEEGSNLKDYIIYFKDLDQETVLAQLQDFQGKRNAKTKRTFYLTDDVVEMLGSSENCGWSSCFRVEGEFHQGAIGMARTPSALMAYEIRESSEDTVITNKLSRTWVIFDDDCEVMRVPTLYTSTSGHERVRKSLANKIADTIWTERPSSKGSRLEVQHDGNFYEDSGSTRSKDAEITRTVYVGNGLTPDGYDDDQGYFVAGFCCNECGDRHHEDEVNWIDSIDEYVCHSCTDTYYSYCNDCGEYYHDDRMNDIDGDMVCDGCRDHGDYGNCDISGELHHLDNLCYIDSKNMYVTSAYATACEYSNEYFLDDEVTYVDGYGTVGDIYLDTVYEDNPELHPDYEEPEEDEDEH